VKAFAAAIGLWTLISLGLLLLDPGAVSTLLSCMRLVGRSSDCEAAQAAANEVVWWWHTLPMLLAVAAGYAGIIGVRLLWNRRRTGDEPEASHG
jgi:hypothetical protein